MTHPDDVSAQALAAAFLLGAAIAASGVAAVAIANGIARRIHRTLNPRTPS